MTRRPTDTALADLSAAYDDFRAGRNARVIERVEGLGDSGGPVARALQLAARGLTLESEGRHEEAAEAMEGALALDVALPDLLTSLARYFSRNERDLLAHYAFLMRDLHTPGAMRGFVDGLPVDERARYSPWAVRNSMTAPDPDLYGLAGFKATLAERHGEAGASLVMASIHAPGQHRQASELPLRPLIDHARGSSADYAELIPRAEVPARWPPAYGEQPRTEYTAATRTLFTATVEDVVVSAKSNILLTQEEALHDVQGDELTRIPVDLRVDPLVSSTDGTNAIVSAPVDRDQLRVVPEAMWLSGVHSAAFGHWLIEFLPKVWALLADAGPGPVPALIDRQMPRQHVEALRFFVDRIRPIVLQPGEQVRVGNLRVASQLVYMPVGPLPGVLAQPGDGVIDAAGLGKLMAPFRSRLEAADGRSDATRVYLARSTAGRRQMADASEVQAALERRGYRTFRLEEMSFAEQVAVIRGAEYVIGPDGSALMMTLLGRPGLRIGVFAHPYLEEYEWYTQATAHLGQRLTVLTGPTVREDPMYRTFSDYRIDPRELDPFLDHLEAVTT